MKKDMNASNLPLWPPRPGDALLIVDVQNDFLPGGSLAVARGDEVVPALNRAIVAFETRDLPVYASRDWHPSQHCSFEAQGGPWPPHCVAGTHGAAFATTLRLPHFTTVTSKASTADEDANSAFQGTDLHQHLYAAGIRRLYIGGLATDYCVLNTVRDALRLGYAVCLLSEAIRARDIEPGDGLRAEEEMAKLGAQVIVVGGLAA
jgi:nicotinamidase/pyrazinamidase